MYSTRHNYTYDLRTSLASGSHSYTIHALTHAYICVAVYVPLALTRSCTDDSFKTCHLWKEGACCSAEFTQQLDADVVTNIDGFYWNHCGNFTPACQRSVACSLCMFPRVTTVSESGCVTTYIILCVDIFSGILAIGLYIMLQ